MPEFETPVAFFVFNRPLLTARVLEQIRAARPRRLFVVADGPRPGQANDPALVDAVRQVIEAGVDWPCELQRDYASANLGCRRRIASGITWVFSQVEEAIILEDDCLPHPDFFPFCAELLSRYRTDARVGHIGGANFQPDPRPGTYYFSHYNHIWGWATWRRAWADYDATMHDWTSVRRTQWLAGHLGDPGAARYWSDHFDGAHSGRIQTWDYQWTYTLWRRGKLAVLPGVNLVQNIGFAPGGTHLGSADAWLSRATQPIGFPLSAPAAVERDRSADQFSERVLFSGGPGRRLRQLIRTWARPFRGKAMSSPP